MKKDNINIQHGTFNNQVVVFASLTLFFMARAKVDALHIYLLPQELLPRVLRNSYLPLHHCLPADNNFSLPEAIN